MLQTGHAAGPPRPIQGSGNALLNNSPTARNDVLEHHYYE